jgi:predicted RNase H-like nuclease
VRFIGVDLAWTTRGGTGLCVVEGGVVRASARVGGDAKLMAWLTPLVSGDVLVAIDAPLIVKNTSGRRRAEQLISRCFGARHASAHSANLALPSFRDGVRGEQLAAALGLDVDPTFAPRTPVRRALEVYRHTAIVALFGLATTLEYKAKPGRTLDSRSRELMELLRHLESLQTADPPLDVSATRAGPSSKRSFWSRGAGPRSPEPKTRSTRTSARTQRSTTGTTGSPAAASPATRSTGTSSRR